MLQELISIIFDNILLLLGIILLNATGYLLLLGALKIIFNNRLTRSEYFSLGLGGWLLPVSILGWLFYFTRSGIVSQLLPILIPILCLLSILFLVRLKPDLKPASHPMDLFLPLALICLVPLRLLFIKDLSLPAYFDSVEHYARIQNIINLKPPTLFPNQGYYHVGYHIITALLATTAKTPIGITMLIIGQWLLAGIPISVFFLIRHVTNSTTAGLFAVVLAALGWYMPAHAVNWGKYPALMSLALIPFIISLAYLFVQYRDLRPSHRQTLAGIVILSLVASTLIHSRSLVIYILIGFAWLAAAWIEKLAGMKKTGTLVLISFGIAAATWLIQKQPLLVILYDPYLHAGITVTIVVLLLSLFAWKADSQLATTCLLWIGFMYGSIFIPVKYSNLTLLDRPFVEMILYLPLTLLGGLGLAGFLKTQNNQLTRQPWISWILIGAVLFHAFENYTFQPSPCCIIIGNDDIAAITWMDINIPPDAAVGVAVTAMKVIPSDIFEGTSGSDAGIWIRPLINRKAFPLSNGTEFNQQQVLDSICEQGIRYLYVGEQGQGFDPAMLSNHPDWYINLLPTSVAQVYEVIGCSH